VVLAALALAGCSGKPSSPPAAGQPAGESKPKATATPGPTEQLQQLLATRAEALTQGHADAFLATSTGEQAKRDKRQIAAAKALPLARVRLTADATEIEGDRATIRADMSYRFEGIDTTYYKTSRMTAIHTPDGWRISNDRPSAGTRAPWEHTRYKARTSKHFLALTPGKLRVGNLMRDLERGRSRMLAGLPGVRPPRKVLVIVARNGRDLNALTTNRKTKSSLIAVHESRFATTGRAKKVSRVWGERVFVMWRSYQAGSSTERRQIVAHELVHAALAHRTSARTPPWLFEGIALYGSRDNRSGEAGALISGRGVLRDPARQGEAERAMSLSLLSRPSALASLHSDVGISFAYSYASAVAYAIAEKHGPRALLRLLTAYNSGKYRGSGRKLADRVVRGTLKTSLRALEREVDAYATANSSF